MKKITRSKIGFQPTKNATFNNWLYTLAFFLLLGTWAGNAATWYSNNATAGTFANNLTNWSANTNGTGANPANFTTASDIFVIQNGHQYHLNATWTGAATGVIQIQSGGSLDIKGFNIATFNRIEIGSNVLTPGSLINTGGARDLTRPITLTGAATIAANGTGTLTLSGAMSYGSNTLTITGTQATTISGTSTLTGNATIVSSGSLALTISGNITNAGNTLTIDGSSATTLSSVLGNGAGGLIKNGSGTLTVSGTQTYTGATTINNGTLKISAAGKIADTSALTVTSPGIFDLNGSAETVGSIAGTGTITSSAATACTLTSANGTNTTFSGIIQNGSSTAVSLTKTGAGTLTLSGANTYTGTTTISVGAINIQNATALGSTTGGTVVASGAALEIQGGISVGAETLTLNGTGMSTAGALRNISGDNTWGGAITLATASRINSDSGLLTISNTITNTTLLLTCGGSGNTSISGVIGSGSGGLTKDGSGTLTLSGSNTYTGTTTISAGIVSVGTINNGGVAGNLGMANNTAAKLLLSGGTLQYTGTTNSSDRSITLSNSSSIDVTTSGIVLTLNGVLSSTGSINKKGTGTLKLTGTNTYTGVTTITDGILSVSSINNGGVAGNIGQAASGAANLILSGGTLQYTGSTSSTNRAFTLTTGTTSNIEITNSSVALTMSGVSATTTGSLTKIGSGKLIFSGANKYTGTTTITSGTLELGVASAIGVSNLVLNGGTFSTGATTGFNETMGTLTVTEVSTINLGTGVHSLVFADSQSTSWTSGKTLIITGWQGTSGVSGTAGKLNVTTSSGITTTQLSQIYFESRGAAMKLTAEIVPTYNCTTPVAQPTGLLFPMVNNTQIKGSFNEAVPAASKYLVVRSTTNTAPTPVNGTVYSIGNTIGSGTVIQASSATTFIDSGLTAATTYYYFIYSYNDACTGTPPIYLTTNPLSNSTTTIATTTKIYYVNNADATLANDVYTTAVGNDSNSGLTTSAPKLTLDAALTAADAAGGGPHTIYVDAGSYKSDFLTIKHNIIGIGSQYVIFDPTLAALRNFGTIGVNNITIKNITFQNYSYDSYGQVFHIDGKTGITLENLIMKNNPGSTPTSPQIWIKGASNVTIKGTKISCAGYNAGNNGGILIQNSSVVSIENCTLYDVQNYQDAGGGVTMSAGGTQTVTINNSTFNKCKAKMGGAIAQSAGTLIVTNSCFMDNHTSGVDGTDPNLAGGHYYNNASTGSSCSFTNCSFTGAYTTAGNTSVDGNAIQFRSANGTFNFDTCTFNNPGVITSYDKGQEFHLREGTALTGTINNCTFGPSTDATGNKVSIFNVDLEPGDVVLKNSGTPTFTGTAFTATGCNTTAPSSTNTAFCNPGSNVLSCGASADCATETIAPLILKCVANKTLTNCSALPDYTSEVGATDDCTYSITQSPVSGTMLPNGDNTITITVTDAFGNSTTCTFIVNMSDCTGCSTTTTWNGSSWSLGAPTLTVSSIINGNYNTSQHGNIDTCNMVINVPYTLTITDNNYVNVVNSVSNTTFNRIALATKGNLVQVNSGATGNAISGGAVDVGEITLTKTTAAQYRWDYVYWSKPISASSTMLTGFSTPFDIKYYWDASQALSAQKSYMGWQNLSSEPTLGTGFISRVRNIHPYATTTAAINLTITGTSNNGDYTTPSYTSFDTDDYAYKNYALLGNPYPCGIDFASFYADNSSVIYGTAYLWTSHTVYPGTGFYQESDYAVFNLTGGVGIGGVAEGGALPAGYAGDVPNGYIASAQGFMVRPKATGTLTFKNSHRAKIAASNSQFFRTKGSNEKNRFWLRVTDAKNLFKEQLIGYIPGATSNLDDAYDALLNTNAQTKFYSKLNDKKLSIQAKGFFDTSDKVAIGYEKPNSIGQKMSISVNKEEGIFDNDQPIYLYDKDLNYYHNLSANAYNFTSTANTDNRFEIVYRTKEGSTITTDENMVVALDNNTVSFKANENITQIYLYDMSGKVIFAKKLDEQAKEYSANIMLSDGVYITKVVFSNNKTVSKKIIKG